MKFSQRFSKLQPYTFAEITRKVNRKRAAGVDVITFGLGDPDIPTPRHIIDRLLDAAQDPPNHRYPETEGLPELRRSIAQWYQQRFGLTLDSSTEVLPLIGAKEGVGHMALCFVDPGDVALVPDPAYPVYSVGTTFAGGEPYAMPLLEENGWLPDLDAISPGVAGKAKVMWLNYPNNPTAAVATEDYFLKVVEFAKRNDIAVCHDAAYSEVAFGGYRPISFLQVEGAMDVAVEFHSLSKTYNMTGWRVGMVVGNAQMIKALADIKSNLDSGIPQAIQLAGIEALTNSQECVAEHNVIYQRRRDALLAVLNGIGLRITPSQATPYVWARVPEGFTSSDFAEILLEEKDIIVTPGSGFGTYGEGYVRFSLTLSDRDLEKAIARFASWHVPPPPSR
jgi:LL-diaminopimelate aminotransferase